ncbi:hypothetical protein PENSPDRAFT_694378 [Peniophora sp. CONT]|nr:hypothetical protein PENSPDRAFT_694378 [Peniophora sp. CONT]
MSISQRRMPDIGSSSNINYTALSLPHFKPPHSAHPPTPRQFANTSTSTNMLNAYRLFSSPSLLFRLFIIARFSRRILPVAAPSPASPLSTRVGAARCAMVSQDISVLSPSFSQVYAQSLVLSDPYYISRSSSCQPSTVIPLVNQFAYKPASSSSNLPTPPTLRLGLRPFSRFCSLPLDYFALWILPAVAPSPMLPSLTGMGGARPVPARLAAASSRLQDLKTLARLRSSLLPRYLLVFSTIIAYGQRIGLRHLLASRATLYFSLLTTPVTIWIPVSLERCLDLPSADVKSCPCRSASIGAVTVDTARCGPFARIVTSGARPVPASLATAVLKTSRPQDFKALALCPVSVQDNLPTFISPLFIGTLHPAPFALSISLTLRPDIISLLAGRTWFLVSRLVLCAACS